MKYIANPVEVHAFTIMKIEKEESPLMSTGLTSYHLILGDHGSEIKRVIATPDMCSRMKPSVGDYWVEQADGYVYLNPKDVFERKYRPEQ